MRKYIILIAGILLLALNANAAFPVDEAGIAAYVRVGDTIEINKTIWVYNEIVHVNKLDIIGKVRVSNYLEDSIPLVYVGADGWIVAYYPKSEPESRIMQWNGYSKPNINTTTLADAISKMATALGVNYESIKGNISYYDFRYPEANGMMVLVEEVLTNGGSNSFSVLMRDNFTLYNASFSHYARDAKLDVDGTIVSSLYVGGYGTPPIRYGFYSTDIFTMDKFHTVNLKISPGGVGPCAASTVWIYRNNL